MNNLHKRLTAAIGGTLVALSMLALWPATGSAAHTAEDAWTCRGVGLRIGTSETGVANAPNNPCKTQVAFPVDLKVPLGALGGIQALGVGAATNADKAFGGFGDGVSAQGGVLGVGVKLLNLRVVIGAVRNIGFVNCGTDPNSPTGLSPVFSGPQKNQTLGLQINNSRELSVEGPFTLPLGILTLKLNQNTQQQNADGGFRLSRAVEINSPLLPTIVIGESRVNYTGNPCDRFRPTAG